MLKEELKAIKILAAGFFIGLGLVLFGGQALAATDLFGYPLSGVMSLAGSPYIVKGDITINNGNTLTIESGVIVKMQSGRSIILLNGNVIIGSASDPNPVVITSYKDDAYGGDTNGDGSTSPGRGDWKYIQVSSASSQITVNNTLIRYGGLSSSMVQILSGARATIANATIEYSNDAGLGIRNGDSVLTLTDSIIRNNYEGLTISFQADATVTGTTFSSNRRGIAIDTDADVAHFSISGNIFSGNNWAVGMPTPAGLDFADLDDTLIVINNDWGSASGPTIASNPAGTGDRIVGNVTYSPWTGQNQAPTLSYTGASGYTTDGVEPNISFKTLNAPIFKISYSDPESETPNYIRAVINNIYYALATTTSGAYIYEAGLASFPKGSFSYHFEVSDGTNTARLPASGELSFEVRNMPVLLVPGIMGTEMWDGSEKVWVDMRDLIMDSDDNFMDVLAMNLDGTPVDSQVTPGDIIRGEPFTDVFNGLIDKLSNLGYVEDIDLFVMPYDWRFDVKTNSNVLKGRIDLVKNQTGSSEVDIIAHSMGGLLTKQFILDNDASSINKLIFVGTPHLGAPKATKALLFGDNMNVFRLSPVRVKYISQNMLSVYELLPSRMYIEQDGRYYFDEAQKILFDFDQTKQFLIDSGLNTILLESADNFHSSAIDNFNTSGIDSYNINGCTTPTITTIVKRGTSEYSVKMMAGDGTVPLGSSRTIDLDNSRQFYFKDHGFLNSLFPRISHATMPSADGIKDLISQIITGATISLPDYATQNVSECYIEGEMVSVHSPVDLHIYDSSGNHVGKGENGDIEYEISGVAYEEIGENKFVFLPTSGGQTYQVELDGTGSGTFSLRVSKVENNEITETAYYSNLPVNTTTEATITLAADVANTVLQVDQNGTGSFNTAPVSAVLNSTQSADITKPSSAIAVSGNSLGGDRYQTSATIDLVSTDDNAGILKTEYSLNNGSTWNTYSNSFIITTLGSNTIQYRATDRAGNVESTKSKTIEVVAAPNAVIIVPSRPIATAPGGQALPNLERSVGQAPQVLGEEVERPANEQYTTDQILDALATADTDVLLDYLGKTRDVILEDKVTQDYGKYLVLDKAATNFIVYGTKSTGKLGIGERAGVLRSYQYVFGKLPQTTNDWQDVVNISTNQLPVKRNTKVEQEARVITRKIYGKVDDKSVLMIAYGLRPEIRDMSKEQSGLSRFGRIFGKMPSSVFDWNVFRKIIY